ncbi:hypothetical protein [Tomitella cavernea]|uniref:Uncharacterized protein n=1 Tax=Tomitella cavernea TaxID=1387982 RepID=A0ABP9CSD5_9ACTN|nr:hypothetical protein [Tomitella cavernea]
MDDEFGFYNAMPKTVVSATMRPEDLAQDRGATTSCAASTTSLVYAFRR